VLRPNWFHILVALASEDLHGSAIAQDVLDRTAGSLRLWPATLYRTLDDLAGAGLIEELTGGRRPEGESRRKRYYRATPRGRQELVAETRRLESLAQAARKRLGDTGA
jgi:DNA-binding PadR family transcriptional regulator